MVKPTAIASAATAVLVAITALLSPAAAFLPATAPLGSSRGLGQQRYSTQRAATGPITMIADLQGSLLGRFRTRTADRPVVQAPPASSPPPKPPSGGGSGSKTDLVEDLNDVGQHLSRFTAAVLEEEKGGSGLAGVTTSGRGIQGSTLKGLPSDFLTRPLAADEATVRGASAVVGGVVGLALGGPLLALVGAAWTSYSCTQPSSDAGAAARGTGQWAVGLYNFMAKMNKKHTLVPRLSGALGGLYGRFKRDVVPADNVEVVNKAESALQGALEVTARLADDFRVPDLIGSALVKTGELSVAAAKGLVEYDRKNKVSEKFWAWMRKELLKEK